MSALRKRSDKIVANATRKVITNGQALRSLEKVLYAANEHAANDLLSGRSTGNNTLLSPAEITRYGKAAAAKFEETQSDFDYVAVAWFRVRWVVENENIARALAFNAKSNDDLVKMLADARTEIDSAIRYERATGSFSRTIQAVSDELRGRGVDVYGMVDVGGKETCWRCHGSGIYYGAGCVENGVFRGYSGTCYRCKGAGKCTVVANITGEIGIEKMAMAAMASDILNATIQR